MLTSSRRFVFAVLGVVACGHDPAPAGSQLTVAVAPLTLPGVEDACYSLVVRNLDGATVAATSAWETSRVWQRASVCSSDFGDGQGSLSYVGPCDADGPGGVRDNSVELELLYLRDGTDVIAELVNPCPPGEHRCVLDVACAKDRDTRVEFNLTVMRDANQGFFDIAVNFEDIFCSAKVDTCDAGPDRVPGNQDDEPLKLLFDGAERRSTAVLAFACTAGADAQTQLFMTDVHLVCGDTTIALDASAVPSSGASGGNVAAPPGQDSVFGYALYTGAEQLMCAGADCRKAYWNVAIGLRVDATGHVVARLAPDGSTAAVASDCRLQATATAADAVRAMVTGGASGPWSTPVGAAYPIVQFDAPISDVDGRLLCVRHGLDGDGAVRTDYSPFSASATFCHRVDRATGEVTGTPGCGPVDFAPPPRWVQVSAYADNNCAVGADGSLTCWGDDKFGASTPPAGHDFVEVSVGQDHSCARKTDGSVVCWGGTAGFQAAAVPPGPFVALASAVESTCALSAPSGSLTCWGDPAINYGQLTPPTPNENFVAFAMHHIWGYGVRADGTLVKWGYDYVYGPPVETTGYDEVGLGPSHGCGLRGGAINCWGAASAQVGLPAGTNFVSIEVRGHSCALDAGGSLTCWAGNGYGSATPPEGSSFRDVAVGNYHTCGVRTDGSLSCHADRQGTQGQAMGQGVPPTGVPFTAIATRNSSMCGLRSDQTFSCWGYNSTQPNARGAGIVSLSGNGGMGCGVRDDGTLACYGTSLAVPSGNDFAAAAAGDQHICGLRQSGAIECNGVNGAGYYGEGNEPAFDPAHPFTALSAGSGTNCAIADGAVTCWGYDSTGIVSAGPSPNTGFSAVSVGTDHACALRVDGSVACWGSNANGKSTPPSPNGGFVKVSAGGTHTCGLKADKTIVCWGQATQGQLDVTAPNTGFTDLGTGTAHTCGLRGDGVILCWGAWGAGGNLRSRNPG